MPGHSSLVDGRWNTLSIAEQLANVGSEVERAIRARETVKEARFERALERALELFDLTAADDRWRGARRREILRAREEFCRLFFETDTPTTGLHDSDSLASLRRYFLYYAIMARRV